MQRLEFSGPVRPIYRSLGFKGLIRLRVRNVSDKSCRENQNTSFIFSDVFPKNIPFMR